jgi:acetolactate synthase-1/2/3 large subunit
MRVSDYIARYLADHGIGHVFIVTGGAVMNLNNVFEWEFLIEKALGNQELACAIVLLSWKEMQ